MRLKAFLVFILSSLVAQTLFAANQKSAFPAPICSDFLTSQRAADDKQIAEFYDYFVNRVRVNEGRPSLVTLPKLYIQSETFRNFYNRRNKTKTFQKFFSQEKNWQTVVEFYSSYFKDLKKSETLMRMRSDSLNEALVSHGYRVDPAKDGYENLQDLSRKNSQRILGSNADAEILALPSDIGDIVKRVRFHYVRNAWHLEIYGRFILSSRQQRSLTLSSGLQSRLDFNTNILKSDDQVFFYVDAIDSKSEVARDKRYGDQPQKLDLNYAHQYGWMSYFVMDPRELTEFHRRFLKNANAESIYDIESTVAHKDLYLADFTPDDFQKITQVLVARKILATENVPLSQYQDDEELKKVVNAVLMPLGLDRLELKIPVAVPASEIR